MPNTLAHAGIQGVLTRSYLKKASFFWIYLGAVIPDLPWILQRIISRFSGINRLDLRLYVVVQASLFFCLLLSAAFAALSESPRKTFFILGSGSFLHLLLDATQIKWANGVHFFVPFSWKLSRFDFFWPESLPTYAMTGFGLIYILFHWKEAFSAPSPLHFRSFRSASTALLFFALYFLLPPLLLQGAENQDNHFVRTLRVPADRPGKAIEVDRGFYTGRASGGQLHGFTETFEVTGLDLDRPALLSIRGRFVTQNKIIIQDFHIHTIFRDAASYLGLSAFALLWLKGIIFKGNQAQVNPR